MITIQITSHRKSVCLRRGDVRVLYFFRHLVYFTLVLRFSNATNIQYYSACEVQSTKLISYASSNRSQIRKLNKFSNFNQYYSTLKIFENPRVVSEDASVGIILIPFIEQ